MLCCLCFGEGSYRGVEMTEDRGRVCSSGPMRAMSFRTLVSENHGVKRTSILFGLMGGNCLLTSTLFAAGAPAVNMARAKTSKRWRMCIAVDGMLVDSISR